MEPLRDSGGHATKTDTCSQHTRAGRRGGHEQRRARSSSVRSACPTASPTTPPVPEAQELTERTPTAVSCPDNAFVYLKNRTLRELLAARGIAHRTTAPYRPRTNGKVERFHQTMAREWGYGLSYRSHRHRARALPHWIDHYNRRRPHNSLGDRPPTSRVHNLPGQDS